MKFYEAYKIMCEDPEAIFCAGCLEYKCDKDRLLHVKKHDEWYVCPNSIGWLNQWDWAQICKRD
jgi:hypothetical protein